MLSAGKLLKNIQTRLPVPTSLPRVYSGIQPTGIPHLGNYLGAIKQWAEIAQASSPSIKDKYIYAIMDLHAMTVKYDPKTYTNSIHQTAACLLAAGLNPKNVIIYRQAQVSQHSELYYLLSSHTLISDLNDMTQWKHKSQQHGALCGLYAYPILMAADILLYRADVVPVGEDQVQHIQLTREIASRINKKFLTSKQLKSPKSNVFKLNLPSAKISNDVARVKSLTKPNKKMSKSDPDKFSCLLLTATDDQIKFAIDNAKVDDNQGLGQKNLVKILVSLTDEQKVDNLNYLEIDKLKSNLTDVIIQKIGPIRDEYHTIMADREELVTILNNGAAEAEEIASREILAIKRMMGLAS